MKAKYIITSALLLLTLVAWNHPDKSDVNQITDYYDATDSTQNIQDQEPDIDENRIIIYPLNHFETESDRKITRELREAIKYDDSLSTNAKNVTISTVYGVVTLRGIVFDGQERSTIESKTFSIPGIKQVDNQIQVRSREANIHYFNS